MVETPLNEQLDHFARRFKKENRSGSDWRLRFSLIGRDPEDLILIPGKTAKDDCATRGIISAGVLFLKKVRLGNGQSRDFEELLGLVPSSDFCVESLAGPQLLSVSQRHPIHCCPTNWIRTFELGTKKSQESQLFPAAPKTRLRLFGNSFSE